MSDRCQYDNKCQESTAYECSCKEMPILLCKKHLDIHIISPSERGHKIQPIIVEIFEDSKKIIINEINKLKLKIFKQQDTFIIEAHHLITEIYSNINQGVNKLKQLATDLNKLLDMIHNTNEIRINHRNPDIISIFQYPKDILIEKFEGLQLINFEIEYKRQNIYLNNIANKLDKKLKVKDSRSAKLYLRLKKLKENAIKNINYYYQMIQLNFMDMLMEIRLFLLVIIAIQELITIIFTAEYAF